KLPLRDAKLVLDKQDGTDGLLVCNTEDHRFDVVNSCNGLLCLCEPFNNDPLVVCNPVTGEFIRLPKVIKRSMTTLYSGIGFHAKTNEYKVVRIVYGVNVEINVAGTPTWRNVRVDGLPSPPTFFQHNVICMGALRDSLYVCNASLPSPVDVWIMKNNDTGILWTKVFTWRRELHRDSLYRPLKHLDNGICILEYCSKKGFIYYDTKNRPKNFLVCGTQEEKLLEVIPHIPSLISLKDVVKGDNVEVLNVHSR
ncbi:F-box protein, partial [Trifolium medium]|nr:F-box protein [Trifolium medium]